MIHNDVLRRLRYALDLSDARMIHLFALSDLAIDETVLRSLLARDTDPEFVACTDAQLGAFLDGLVIDRRGPRDPAAPARPKGDNRLDNNLVLKKLRIALQLQEDDMLALLKLGGMDLSASELGALFRNEQHKHYRAAGDQLLRNFLKGLTQKLRPESTS